MGFIYKDYLLRSKSTQLPESNRWTVQITVSHQKDSEGKPREQTFSYENTVSSKEMADMEGIIFARKIIDSHAKVWLPYWRACKRWIASLESQLETAQGLYDDANRDWRAMKSRAESLTEELRLLKAEREK